MNETVETRERFFDAAHLRSLLIKPRILRNYIQESFRITRASLGDIVIVNGLFTVLLTVVYFALVPVVFQLSYIRQYQNFLLGLIGLPVAAFLLCGLIKYYRALTRGQAPRPWMLFRGSRNYLTMLRFCLGYYLLYVVSFKVLFYITDYDGVIQIRIIMGVSFFLWIMARLIFTPMFIIDGDNSLYQAVKNSFLLTSGRTIKTFILIMVFGFFLFLGIPFLFVGLFISIAPAMIAFVLVYDIYNQNEHSHREIIEEAAIAEVEAPPAKAKPARKKKAKKKTARKK